MSKFKVGQKVYYICSIDNTIQVHKVVSTKTALKKYFGFPKDQEARKKCVKDIIKENKQDKPVFVENCQDKVVGWMPESELQLYTKTVEILYGK